MEYVEPIHSSSTSSSSCCNRGYVFTRAGILRIGIIVGNFFFFFKVKLIQLIFFLTQKMFQFAGLVSISCLIRQKYHGTLIATDTMSAFLFFSCFGFVFAIIQFAINISNCIQSGRCRNCKWHLMV
jgi:hypothetical protein